MFVATVLAVPSVASVIDTFAGAEARDLPNGIRVVARERKGLPLVAIDIWVSAGSANERRGEESAAHFLEHMIFKGTPKRGPGEIDGEIEDLGALLNAGTLRDAAHFYTTVASTHLGTALGVIADGIRNASLDTREMERERAVILDEMARAEGDPVHAAVTSVYASMFPGDPYGRPILGITDAIRSATRDAVVAFHRRRYAPANTTVVLVGDVSVEDAVKAATSAFGDWHGEATASAEPSPLLAPADVPASPLPATPRAIAVGFRLGRAPTSAETAAGVVIAAMLREEIVARLQPRDRDRLRSSDPVVDFTPLRRDAVMIVVAEGSGAAEVPRAVEQAALRLRTGLFAATDVAAGSRDALGRFVYDTETVAAQARMLGLYDRVLGGFVDAVGYPTELEHATTEQIHVLATALLDPTRMRMCGTGTPDDGQ
jgi:zinc protease